MTQIMTNLNTDDIANVLRERFKGVTNKKFILDTIEYHMEIK